MKKKYSKPLLEVEDFRLDTSIASNCQEVIDMGPEYGSHKVCEEYYDKTGEEMPATLNAGPYNVDFWENCDCYTAASGIFFTS